MNGSATTALPTRMDVGPPRNLAIQRTIRRVTPISANPASINSCAVLPYAFSQIGSEEPPLRPPLCVLYAQQPSGQAANHLSLFHKSHMLLGHELLHHIVDGHHYRRWLCLRPFIEHGRRPHVADHRWYVFLGCIRIPWSSASGIYPVAGCHCIVMVIGLARNPASACHSGLPMPSSPMSNPLPAVLHLMASCITSVVMGATSSGGRFQMRAFGVPVDRRPVV